MKKLWILLILLPLFSGCVMTKKQKAFMKESRVFMKKLGDQVKSNSGFIMAMNPKVPEAKQNFRNASALAVAISAHADAKFPGLSVNWEAVTKVASIAVKTITNSVISPGGIAGGVASTVLGSVALWLRRKKTVAEELQKDAENKADGLKVAGYKAALEPDKEKATMFIREAKYSM